MGLRIETFDVNGPMLIHGVRHHDDRGYFSETFKELEFTELGLPHFVQDNLSLSKRGVFRGMHWQLPPLEQGKLVTCLAGSIIDFAIDLRSESATFGHEIAIELAHDKPASLWVPPGFAHGFYAREDGSLVSYKVTNRWSSSHERSCRLSALALSKLGGSILLSKKDTEAPSLSQVNLTDLF
jgi:dTDP-4-dehydrorhamnose 3,5-epimerase